MRRFFVPAMAFVSLFLAGCSSVPNDPTLILQANKTPEQFANCVMPKLQEKALNPTMSQTQRRYKIIVPSQFAADNVLEAYKSSSGAKVFLYERKLLASTFVPSSFELAAQECL